MKAVTLVKWRDRSFLLVGTVMVQKSDDPTRLFELMSKPVALRSSLFDPLLPNDLGASGGIPISNPLPFEGLPKNKLSNLVEQASQCVLLR